MMRFFMLYGEATTPFAVNEPVTVTPLDVIPNTVEPPDCILRLPVLSAVVIMPPAPDVEAFIELAIYISYNITQRAPDGTVTAAPELIVTGPTENPFLPEVNV